MTVYLVRYYDDVCGAFTSEALAEAWIARQRVKVKRRSSIVPHLYVDAYVVDAVADLK